MKLELLPRTVRLPHERGSVRRVYSARVTPDGLQSNMTVAMYQGDGSEEGGFRFINSFLDIILFSRGRNGAVKSHDIHGFAIRISCNSLRSQPQLTHTLKSSTEHFLNLRQHSHFSTMYIYAYRVTELTLKSGCTFWVHRMTGRLCAGLVPSESHWKADLDELSSLAPLHAPGQEIHTIDSLRSRFITVNVGAVYSSSDHFNPVAWLDIETDGTDWYGGNGDVMVNGWTQCQASQYGRGNKDRLSVYGAVDGGLGEVLGCSQDLARHLGDPLYRLSTEMRPPFAHMDAQGEPHSKEHRRNWPSMDHAPQENDQVKPWRLHDDISPISMSSTFIMHVLIRYLALCGLCGHVWLRL
ncbi:hypothetical protein B0H19DRAFT_1244028 [Mycena capillaripes]|nr:hypothetical protein B0H19DRAFT_1244028 [Mycena capillaripes]